MFTDRTQQTVNATVTTIVTTLAVLFTANGSALAQSGNGGRLSTNPNDLRDAFAKHPTQANSPKAFARFVAENPMLGQRYARHFGVPQERIVSFFQNALVPRTLNQSKTLSTFGVTDSGKIYPVKTTLPAGTKVWATREGVPVLKWNCSNPLSTLLPGATLETSPLEVVSTPSSVLPSGFPVLDVPGTFAANSSILPGDGSDLALSPPLPALDFAFGVPATDVVASAALPGIGEVIDAGASSISDYWPALFIPVIFAFNQGGNGGETFVGETPPLALPVAVESAPPPIDAFNPVVVPEGNTALLLLGGLPILGLAYRVANRNKK